MCLSCSHDSNPHCVVLRSCDRCGCVQRPFAVLPQRRWSNDHRQRGSTTRVPLPPRQLTVGVSGTALSTGVEPSGSFTLGGVPPGDVQLTFSSDGATSTVSVANIADQEVIDLQVIIANGKASVLNEARGNGPNKNRGVVIRKFTNGEHVSKAPGPVIPVGDPGRGRT